jgi:polyferredoxin
VINYFLSLPRASWWVRLLFLVVAIPFIFMAVTQWPNLHDNLTIVRWYSRIIVAIAIAELPWMFIVAVFGRLPRGYSRMFGNLHKNISQIHDDLKEERKRSSEL